MRIDDQIKTMCVKSNISMAELARRMNKSPQSFNQKMKRGSFTIDDLKDIAIVLGCKLECDFVYLNGEKISID